MEYNSLMIGFILGRPVRPVDFSIAAGSNELPLEERLEEVMVRRILFGEPAAEEEAVEACDISADIFSTFSSDAAS